MVKHNLKKLSLLLPLLFLIGNAQALDIIPSNSQTYYRLGGGSDISMPPVTNQKDLTVGGDLNTDLNYSCNGFNPAISLSNTFNNMKNSIEGLNSDVVNSATSAIGSLPMFLLQKASPELYNLIQNTITNAQDTFHMNMKSCQDALVQIKTGKSPYQDWFSISDSEGWMNYAKSAKQGQDIDINTAVKQITKDPRQYGIPWVHNGQNSGGSQGNQVPIHVIYDVVVAGYNVLVDPTRALDDKSPAPVQAELAHYWKTPDAAGQWARLVLGDITISSKTQESTHPGVGLTTLLQTCPAQANNDLTCAKTINNKLTRIVSSGGYPTGEQLKAVSTNALLLTPQVITSIRNMTRENQAIAISKLSSDDALQNLVDEALMLRRVLIAGSQTKPVHNLKPALVTIQKSIHILDQDIKNVMFEHDIRKQMISNTIATLLNMENSNKAQALSEHDQTQVCT